MPGHTPEKPDLGEVHVAQHNLGSTATLEELRTEEIRLLEEYTSEEYQRQRVVDYPAIGDQLDALFHAGVFPAEMAAAIQAIKDKYPKGSA